MFLFLAEKTKCSKFVSDKTLTINTTVFNHSNHKILLQAINIAIVCNTQYVEERKKYWYICWTNKILVTVTFVSRSERSVANVVVVCYSILQLFPPHCP